MLFSHTEELGSPAFFYGILNTMDMGLRKLKWQPSMALSPTTVSPGIPSDHPPHRHTLV